VPPWVKQPLIAAKAAFLGRDWSTAAQVLEQARQMGNHSVEILDNLVVAYALEAERAQGSDFYAKALLISDQIIEHFPSDATVYFNRALIFEQLGRRNDAIASFKKFIAMEPDPRWKEEANDRLRLLS